jgi:hypothetical protein
MPVTWRVGRERVWPPLLVFSLALALRVAHVLALRRSAYFVHPVLDAGTYHEAALALVRGEGYPEAVFWQPPGYPFFLALVYAVAGPGFLVPRLVQAVLGASTAVVTYAVGARVFGRTVGLLAGLGVAAYGTLIYYDGELLTPALGTLLELVAVFLAVRAPAEPAPRTAWLAAGLFAGLAALVTATTLVLVPVMAAFARRRAAWVLVGVVCAVAPATARNWIEGHQFVLVSSNAGINLFVGNNKHYDAMVGMRPGRDWQALLRAPSHYGVRGAAAASGFFVRRVVLYARTDPAGFMLLQARKLRLLLGGDEVLRNQEIYPVRADSPVLRVLLWKAPGLAFPFGLLLPAAVLGLVVGARRAPMLVAMVLVQAAAVVAFFVTARYRAPLVPLLSVFAAEGVRWLGAATPRGRLAALGLVVPLYLLANLGQGAMPRRMNPDAEFGLATWLEREGRRAEALPLYERVARENPTYWDAWERLSRALRAEGRVDEAEAALRTARGIVPEFFDTLLILGRIRDAEGQWRDAADYYRRALAMEPDDPVARAGLARALGRVEGGTGTGPPVDDGRGPHPGLTP